MSAVFEVRARVAAPRGALYAWHARPGAFVRLAPRAGSVRLLEDSGGIEDGARKVLALGPLGIPWVAVHDSHVAGRRFRDVQVRGPFRRWAHVHEFQDDGPQASVLVDRVEYELPLGRLGELVAGRIVRGILARLFAERHRVTVHDVELFAAEPPPPTPVDVRGDARSAGLLEAFLGAGGWSVEPGAPSVVEVRSGAVRLDGVPLASLLRCDDAELAAVHRALRARLFAGAKLPR